MWSTMFGRVRSICSRDVGAVVLREQCVKLPSWRLDAGCWMFFVWISVGG